jgi:SAM-dependent methyltransferase
MTAITERFSEKVSDYAKHRPSYPAEAIDFVMRALDLSRGSIVADIGAGTGISSVLFLDRGVRVCAVEPNAPMRASAEAWLGAREGYSSHAGTAEATTLPDASVDAIIAAQAFHWFDPEKARGEALRILRPRSSANVALLWNARRPTGTAFLEGYEQLLLDRSVDYAKVRHQNVAASDAVDRFFAGPASRWSTPSTQPYDWDGLVGRTRSASYVPGPSHPAYERFYAALRELFDRANENGFVAFEYDVDVIYGSIR